MLFFKSSGVSSTFRSGSKPFLSIPRPFGVYHLATVTLISEFSLSCSNSWTEPYDASGKPESNGMYEYSITSMLNDKARVYKGGSWKDRAYWMVPGTRRFLDQRQATAWIGFRCAMTRVGSPVGLGGR